jgi:hypothetical protein
MEHARSLGEALLAGTMAGRGFVSEASRLAHVQDRRPGVYLKPSASTDVVPPLGVNAMVPPDAPLAPPVLSAEAREAERCVRQLLLALMSSLCHRIWNPSALAASAWLVPEGKRLEDFVPPPTVPTLTATAAAALGAPLPARVGSTEWMDAYAALARAQFVAFLSAVIKGAPVSFSTMVLCHYHLEAAAARGALPVDAEGQPLAPRLVLLAYMSLSAKYTLDTPGSCRTWGRIGGVPPTVLAEAELAVLRARNFDLFVAPCDLILYTHHLAQAADRMSFNGTDAPPSPPLPTTPPLAAAARMPMPVPVLVAVPSTSMDKMAAMQVLPTPTLPLAFMTTMTIPAPVSALASAPLKRKAAVAPEAAYLPTLVPVAVPVAMPMPTTTTTRASRSATMATALATAMATAPVPVPVPVAPTATTMPPPQPAYVPLLTSMPPVLFPAAHLREMATQAPPARRRALPGTSGSGTREGVAAPSSKPVLYAVPSWPTAAAAAIWTAAPTLHLRGYGGA